MKAIIVEIKGSYAAALSDDGVVSKIKNRNYCLGQEIVIKNKSNNLIKVVASAAAAIMIFVTPAWAYLAPYSYVSLDVNPSFEFSVNRFDRVLTVKAVNDDGEEFVKNINVQGLKNKEIQNAVKNILNELENQGYIIDGEENGVIVATYSKTQDKTDMLAEKLRNAVNEQVGEQQNAEVNIKEKPEKLEKPEEKEKPEKAKDTEINSSEAVEETEDTKETDKKPEKLEKPENQEKSKKHIQVIEVTEEEVDAAKKLKVTPGKKNLVDNLYQAAGSEEINKEEWLKKSVQEINAKIKEFKEQEKQTENKNNNSNGNNANQEGNNAKGKNN